MYPYSLRLASILLASLGSAAAALAQTTPDIEGAWRYGLVGGEWNGACGAPNLPEIASEWGDLVFASDGTAIVTSNRHDVCPSGTVTWSTSTVSATWSLGNDNVLTLDLNPANPGTDVVLLRVRADGLAMIFEPIPGDPGLLVAVPLRSGLTTADLAGAYHVARIVHGQHPGGVSVRTELGVVTFDGLGGWVESGQGHYVDETGATVDQAFSRSGTYSVASDGTVIINGTFPGAVMKDEDDATSARQDFVFWMHDDGIEAGLTVACRKEAFQSSTPLDFQWHMSQFEVEPQPPGGPGGKPRFSSALGNLHWDWLAGTMKAKVYTVISSAGGASTSGPDLVPGIFTLQTTGELVASFVGSPPGFVGAVGADENFGFFLGQDGSVASLFLMFRNCLEASSYGSGTSGTGGGFPGIHAEGGEPALGNTSFSLLVENGPVASPGCLLVASAPSSGIPFFGGTLWLDPATILLCHVFVLDGTGEAGLPAPMPSDVSLDGTELYLQAGLVDIGAPAGASMTPGLLVKICK